MAWAELQPIVQHLRVYDDNVPPGGPYRHIITVVSLPGGEALITGLKADAESRFTRADWRAISRTMLDAGYARARWERVSRDGTTRTVMTER